MDQWQYTNQQATSRRYTGDAQQSQQSPSSQAQQQQQQQRSTRYNTLPQLQSQSAFQHDQYNPAYSHSLTTSPAMPRDANGDIAMQDFVMRPHHQSHGSNARLTAQQPGEQSSAAQRYSPSEITTSTPANQYSTTSHTTNHNSYAQMPQSPTRASTYSSPTSYQSTRLQAQHLPPITPYSSIMDVYPQSATQQLNAVFGNDPKSPRRNIPSVPGQTAGRGPVPEFQKLRSLEDLQPQINAQPAFRRADPEGGFISVCVNEIQPSRLLTHSYSHCKPSPPTYLPPIEYVILVSNTSQAAIHAAS